MNILRENILSKEKLGVDHHDMGFLYTPSCVAAYKLTDNEWKLYW